MIILGEITSGNNVFPYDVRSSVTWLLNRSNRIANSRGEEIGNGTTPPG